MSNTRLDIREPTDLGPSAVLRIARNEAIPELSDGLADRIAERCQNVRSALTSGNLVYGVNTGMGALSENRLGEQEQARHQQSLILARSVGTPPWLSREETRAVLAVRLRTFLNNDSGVSAKLCQQLADMLALDVIPAVPRSGMGTAGEIIALAHMAAPISGHGNVLSPAGSDDNSSVPAGPALETAGLRPLSLGPKEGVALIEGVPVTTALAILCAHDARTALRQCLHILAAEISLTGASRDALDPALARADDVLASVTAEVLRLAGSTQSPRALQPPVSFRVSGQVLAHLSRAVTMLDSAVTRALDGITDSPAYVGQGDSGRFLGTAGFYGYDLASHLQILTVALVGAAELGATRLHRMMDPKVSGLTAQLSPQPGPHTGLTPVHKRAVGVTHGLRRLTVPSTIGPVETSAGQEDVQSFSIEAAESCRQAINGLTEVLACELLAVHQCRCLGAELSPDAARGLAAVLDSVAAVLPGTPYDRPFGQDLSVLRSLLGSGWGGSPTVRIPPAASLTPGATLQHPV